MARLGRSYTIPVITRTPAPDAPVATVGGRGALIVSAPPPPSRGFAPTVTRTAPDTPPLSPTPAPVLVAAPVSPVSRGSAILSSAPAVGNSGQETVVVPPAAVPRAQAPTVIAAMPDTLPPVGGVSALVVAAPKSAAGKPALLVLAALAEVRSAAGPGPLLVSAPALPSRGLAILSSAPAEVQFGGPLIVASPPPPAPVSEALITQAPIAQDTPSTPAPLVAGSYTARPPSVFVLLRAASAEIALAGPLIVGAGTPARAAALTLITQTPSPAAAATPTPPPLILDQPTTPPRLPLTVVLRGNLGTLGFAAAPPPRLVVPRPPPRSTRLIVTVTASGSAGTATSGRREHPGYRNTGNLTAATLTASLTAPAGTVTLAAPAATVAVGPGDRTAALGPQDRTVDIPTGDESAAMVAPELTLI